MASLMHQSFQNAGGVPRVASILNMADRATERALMENLAEESPDLVVEIRRLMFVFDDITKLSEKDVQTVLKNVESAQWAMALKCASEELKDKILNNITPRQRSVAINIIAIALYSCDKVGNSSINCTHFCQNDTPQDLTIWFGRHRALYLFKFQQCF